MGSCYVVWLGFKLNPEGKGRLQMGETRRILKHWQVPDNVTRHWTFHYNIVIYKCVESHPQSSHAIGWPHLVGLGNNVMSLESHEQSQKQKDSSLYLLWKENLRKVRADFIILGLCSGSFRWKTILVMHSFVWVGFLVLHQLLQYLTSGWYQDGKTRINPDCG